MEREGGRERERERDYSFDSSFNIVQKMLPGSNFKSTSSLKKHKLVTP